MVNALLELIPSLMKAVRGSYKITKWVTAKHKKPISLLSQ